MLSLCLFSKPRRRVGVQVERCEWPVSQRVSFTAKESASDTPLDRRSYAGHCGEKKSPFVPAGNQTPNFSAALAVVSRYRRLCELSFKLR